VSYTWRHLTVDDTPAWSALLTAIAKHDGTDFEIAADELAEELQDPGGDITRDTVAVTDSDGDLVAYGTVHQPVERPDGVVRARFGGGVHPGHRNRGIGAGALTRLEGRVGELGRAAFPGRPLRPITGTATTAGQEFLARRGYSVVRYWHTMARSLDEPIGAPTGDAVAFSPQFDEAVRLAHIDAFSGHWDFAAPEPERWQHWFTGTRALRPQCSPIAVADDGTVDGYVLAYEFTPGEVYFGIIGVRDRARGRRLGAGLVNAALTWARDAGYQVAKLEVDTDNATGAGRLYESAGFTVTHSSVSCQRDEPV
jgi:GNAT superfamily N-acetyltransferase